MAERFLSVVLRASNRRLKADLRQSHRTIKGFARDTRSLLTTAFAAGVGGFAGAFSVSGLANFGREVLNNEELLERIGIQAGLSKDQMASLRSTAVETGKAFGLSTNQVLQAANAIINLEGAAGFSEEKMKVLAQASVATGANLNDLAGVAFALRSSFKINEPAALAKALSAVTAAGKQGSIPLNEMSMVLQQISADFKEVSGSGVEGAADLAAALQVARTGFGSAAETGTGLKAFVQQLSQNADKFRAFGVRVTQIGKDGKERLLPIREALDNIEKSPILKRKRFMQQVFGSAEAQKFVKLLIANREQFDALSDSARKANDVQADSQRFLESEAGRLKIAVARAKTQIESLFTPERIQAFVGLIENQIVPALDFIVDHSKEIAVAIGLWKVGPAVFQLGKFVALLGRGVGQAGGLLSVFGKMGGASGAVLGAVGGLAAPLAAATAGAWLLVKAYQEATKENEKVTEELIRQAEIQGKIVGKRSQFDPQGRADARRQAAEELRKSVQASNKLIFDDSFDELITGSRRLAKQAAATEARGGARAAFTEGDINELEALRARFVETRGALSEKETARFTELLNKTGIGGKLGGEFVGGAAGLEAAQKAARLEAEAAALEAVEKARFGRRDFKPEGFDVGGAATAAGIVDPFQRKQFEKFALAELLKTAPGLGSTLGLGDKGLRLGGERLAVNEQGRVVRKSIEAPGGGILGGIQAAAQGAAALVSGRFDASISEKLDNLNANLERLAERKISVQIDGQEVATATSNSIRNRRAPR